MLAELQAAPIFTQRQEQVLDLGRVVSSRPISEFVEDRGKESVLCEDARFLVHDVCKEPVKFDQHFCLRYVGDFFRAVNPTFMEIEKRITDNQMLCHPFSAPYLIEAVTRQAKLIRGESILVLSSQIPFEKCPHMMRITRKNPAAPWKVAIYRIDNLLTKMGRDCPIIIADHAFET